MSAKFKAALEARIKAVKDANKKVVKVGIVGYQHYDDGTPVAYVAAIHEYGSPSTNIPPRPFFRPTVAAQKKTWAGISQQILKNGGTVEDMLDSVGSRAAGDIFETISNIDAPPLAISTKKARNRKAHKQTEKYGKKPNAVSIKPLVDTKLLIDSIGYVVVDKE